MKVQKKQIANYYGLVIPDKNLTPNACSVNYADTGITTSRSPVGGVAVAVNGIQKVLGNGVITKDCFFAPYFNLFFTSLSGDGNFASSGALYIDGSAWCWGTGTSGQLGDNTTVNKSSPVSVVGAHSFATFKGGSSNCHIAAKSDGTCWTWGVGTGGRLGDNTTLSRSSPVSVVGAHSFISVQMSANGYGLKLNNGTIWSWGDGSVGQLGDNTTVNKSSPVSVVGAHSFATFGAGLGPGNSNVVALKSNDGSAWSWGNSANGQLGDNTTNDRSSPVSVIGGHSFISLSVCNFTSALKSDGSAWCWGVGVNGQLGEGTSVASRSSPVSVIGGHSFIATSSGTAHTVALKSDGSAWCWGVNGSGRCGDNTTNDRSSPVSVLGTHSFISVSTGNNHSMGLKSDGSVWMWGQGNAGQLGDNTTASKSSPVSVVNTGGLARSLSGIINGDKLFWNAVISGQNLTSVDRVDLNYMALPFI